MGRIVTGQAVDADGMAEVLLVARLIGGLCLLLMNGFFVTTEFAMTRIRQFPEDEFRDGGGLERAWEMTERLEIYLSGCQVGITIASVGLGIVAEPAVAALVDGAFTALGISPSIRPRGHAAVSVVVAFTIINLAHVIIGEQAPTYFGVERTKLAAKYGAAPLYYWTLLMSPVISFADWAAKGLLGLFGVTMTRAWTEAEEGEELGRGELREEMGRVLSQGELPEERRREVINALEIGNRPVSEIVIPRDEMVSLSTEDSVEENLQKIRENPQYVRFPLVGESIDEVEGIVYSPTVLSQLEALQEGDRKFEDLAAPPMTVDADMAISELIDRFQEENQELAVVKDEGRVVGMVTSTDAFETITGELKDPLDLGAD